MQTLPVDLWTIPLALACPTHLSPDESARAIRFRFEDDRIRWTRARSSLRQVLSTYAGSDPDRLRFVYGENGKPALQSPTDIEFNLSHAGEWAMIAVTRSIPVGVDIEHIRSNIEMADLLRRLGETNIPDTIPAQFQASLFQLWTRREAKSKAVGAGLFDQPPSDVYAVDVTAPPGYAASLALIGCLPEIRYCGNR
jgi:4'-phosphopantetheinyl transferase